MSRLFALLPWLALLASSTVHAGGLFVLDRGARPLSRGGAFVAGVDDPSALWYNPAGLDESKNQVLTDATLTVLLASYQRRYDDGTDSPRVQASRWPLPIPTLAFSHDLGFKDLTFGAGIFAPNASLLSWPRSLSSNGTTLPSPTRYSLISLQGSVLSNFAVGLAWHGIKGLSVGADAQIVGGRFKAQVALSACGDGVVCNFPEDPQFDGYATLSVLPAYGFTGVLGAKYTIKNALRLGVSAMMPYTLRGPASLHAVLPRDNPILENASLQGSRAQVSLNFPLILRAGIELRPWPSLRLELAFVWEQWSAQKTIDASPEGVRLTGIRGVGDYQLGKISLPRDMRDTWSVRVGYELLVPEPLLPRALRSRRLALRGGLAYEKGAFDSRTLTPLTLDVDKLLLTGGFSVNVGKRTRLETAAGWYSMRNINVTRSTIERPQALRPPSTADNTTLGNGRYTVEAFYLGGGLTFTLD